MPIAEIYGAQTRPLFLFCTKMSKKVVPIAEITKNQKKFQKIGPFFVLSNVYIGGREEIVAGIGKQLRKQQKTAPAFVQTAENAFFRENFAKMCKVLPLSSAYRNRG